jgi:hypothetical protein
MMNEKQLDEIYVQAMRQVWQHPSNNQRSTILERLKPFQGAFSKIVDLGSGDAYYLETLRPTKYVFVEPNTIFRRECLSRSESLQIEAVPLESIAQLLKTKHIASSNLVLLIHSLLYLKIEEINRLFPKLSEKSLILIYPSLFCSTTIQFEELIGDVSSRDKIKIANKFWGVPERTEEVQTQFRLPSDIDLDLLSFIIGNKIFIKQFNKNIWDKARKFVSVNVDSWRKDNEFVIPQNQIIKFHIKKSS